MGQVARFFCVGAGATIIHVAAAVLYHRLGLSPLWANFCAFVTAFLPSYAGNLLWTFDGTAMVGQSLRRFLAISIGGFILNQAIVYAITEHAHLPLWVALIPVVMVIPLVGYVLSKLWAFRPRAGSAT